MAELVIHIGPHRTGTTAIQSLLHSASDELRQQGLNYVASGRPSVPPWPTGWDAAHHELAWLTVGAHGHQVTTKAAWGLVLAEIDIEPELVHVVSAEDFCEATDSQVADLAEVLADHEVRVVMYERDPVMWALSRYRQLVAGDQSSETLSFEQFIQTRRVDFDALRSRWAGQFNVEVRPFGPGVRGDFAALLGAELRGAPDESEPVNAARRDRQVQAARLLNRTLQWPLIGDVMRRVRSIVIARYRRPSQRLVLAVLWPWARRPIATPEQMERLRPR